VNEASAQNWLFDARKIGLGSTGGENLASRMIEEEYDYRVIPLPFGLIQVIPDIERLDPSNDAFDLVRTIEYAAAPLHWTIGRDSGDSTADDFVVDVINGELRRDLNDYQGFVPVNQPAAAGLAAPQWGKTFRVWQGGGAFHGIYVGAGPYGSLQTSSTIDERLIEILRAEERLYMPLAQLTAQNRTHGQVALAIAGGYRAGFPFPVGVGLGSEREGVHIAANYNYLRGVRYHDVESRLRMATDEAGLLTADAFDPSQPPPLLVSRVSAGSGTGMAIDLGVGVVINHWEFGVGANGVGNFIDWADAEETTYFHASLFQGNGDLSEGGTVPVGDLHVELPVDYRANVAYDVGRWVAVAGFGRGLQGRTFNGGGELRLGTVDVRGGAAYSRERWNPSGGVGLHLSRRVAGDLPR
jgi:hypothetical protein